jgi:HSP20 family protein
MLITRYKRPTLSQRANPYRSFDMFNELFKTFEQMQDESTNLMDFNPNVNTREGQEAYHIEVDLPGIKKEDVDINVEDNILTISGKREFKDEVKEENYYKVESNYGSFSRSFTLPEKVDVENIKASSSNGVLEVVIPKLKVITEKTRKIEIK